MKVDFIKNLTILFMWKQWINAIIGLGVIAVSFMGLTAAALMYTLVIGGIVLVVLSLWSAYEISTETGESNVLRHA
jgi:hypothetical protein